ncbi:hypothetical protein IQ235_13575 [Oscillatoriales cyanobacterium LEGE 11467]|uniref:Uncharacterized protein n=1 Tax=Zarconia navalis LEGE 11467 TaxID=1828826 RepID=A0A928W206_9CYAN|nr:hypothetical protein [Zarconia navalis]MBE9041810.1 hypothetical protein [Zarconia navalis LEGE 11467]
MQFLIVTVILAASIWASIFQDAEQLTSEEKKQLDDFFENPENFVANSKAVGDILKLLKKCEDKDIGKYYGQLRYKMGTLIETHGWNNVAPMFEDIAQFCLNKQSPDDKQKEVLKNARESLKVYNK